MFPEAQPREWAAAAPARRRGWVNNSGVEVFGICTEPGARNGKEDLVRIIERGADSYAFGGTDRDLGTIC